MTNRIQIFKWLFMAPPDDCTNDSDLRSCRQAVRDIVNPCTWLCSTSRYHARQVIAESHGIADEVERASFIRDQIKDLASLNGISRTVSMRLIREAEASVKDLGPIVWENQATNHYRHCGQTWTDASDISACPSCFIITSPTHSKMV